MFVWAWTYDALDLKYKKLKKDHEALIKKMEDLEKEIKKYRFLDFDYEEVNKRIQKGTSKNIPFVELNDKGQISAITITDRMPLHHAVYTEYSVNNAPLETIPTKHEVTFPIEKSATKNKEPEQKEEFVTGGSFGGERESFVTVGRMEDDRPSFSSTSYSDKSAEKSSDSYSSSSYSSSSSDSSSSSSSSSDSGSSSSSSDSSF